MKKTKWDLSIQDQKNWQPIDPGQRGKFVVVHKSTGQVVRASGPSFTAILQVLGWNPDNVVAVLLKGGGTDEVLITPYVGVQTLIDSDETYGPEKG